MSTTTNLSSRLREETKSAHSSAEEAPLFHAIFDGTCSREAMLGLERALLDVYIALEDCLQTHADDPRVGQFAIPELYRVSAIRSDLRELMPESLEQPTVPAADTYAAHLRELGRNAPLLLIAHAYTRYLGDLSGGQMLARKAKTIVGQDLAFYAFPEIKNPGAAKTDFRNRLDALELTPAEADAIVAEACTAFELNAAIADEVWRA